MSRPARRAARRAPAAIVRRSLERAQDVLPGGGMDALEQRQDLLADQPAGGRGVRRIGTERKPALAAERLGLLAPERQQRAYHPVLAARLDPLRVAARDEPVEDRLDLIARGVAGGAQPLRPLRVAEVAQPGLAQAARRPRARPPRRARRRRSVRRRRTPLRAARGRRGARRRGSRARAGDGRDRSSRRRRRRGRAPPPPGSISRCWRICASTRSSTSIGEVCITTPGAATHRSSRPRRRSSSGGAERVRHGVADERDARSRRLPLARSQRVGDRKRVRDDEDRLLRPREQGAEGMRVPLDDRDAALAPVSRRRRRRVRRTPTAGTPRACFPS